MQRVFGGQVIGQALVAATRTVEGVLPHSLHAYFLLAGDPKVPIVYEVDRIRDGKSFTTRRVVAIQHGQRDLLDVGVVPQRRGRASTIRCRCRTCRIRTQLPSDAEIKQNILPQLPEPVRRYYERERPIELRPVEFGRYVGKKQRGRPLQHLDAHHRAAARRSGDPSLRAGLCLGHDAARHRAAAASAQRVRPRHHGREPRPCAVVSPAVPRRRMAALHPGQPELCTARAASAAA